MSVFGRYARYYDAIYQDKDYLAECDVVEAEIRSRLGEGPKRMLDAGCGTGTHALALARRGHSVVGVDRSSAMLDVARSKVTLDGGDVRFLEGDLRTLDLGATFDAVTCLFAAISYQLATADVQAALRSFRRHLEVGGLAIFDYWSGPAVVAIGPTPRVVEVEWEGRRIVRQATPVETDLVAQTHITEYRVRVLDGEEVVDEVIERHQVRFLFPREVVHYAEESGFEVCELWGGWDRRPLTKDCWVGVVVARARSGEG